MIRARRRRVARATALLALAGAAVGAGAMGAAAPAGAAAPTTYTYTQGLPGSPFTLAGGAPPATIALGGGSDPYLSLATGISLVIDARSRGYQGQYPRDPRSVQVLSNGDLLIADRQNDAVLRFRPDGTLRWSYTAVDNPAMKWPFFVQLTARGTYLITDRSACHVFEVTAAKRIVWQYGKPPSPIDAPPGAGQLSDPFFAVRTQDDKYTLICDNKGTNRVIKVRDADYAPGEANDGYTDASIVWQYGQNGAPGDGPGQLNSPRSAQLLPNGNVLICCSETQAGGAGANRILEVRAADYRAGRPNLGYTSQSVVWQYSTGLLAGDQTVDPNQALRTANGTTFIADTGNNRILGVDRSGNVVYRFGSPSDTSSEGLDQPRGISFMPDGRLAVADQGHNRVVAIGATARASVTSQGLSLGFPGKVKEFFGISWSTQEPDGTGLTLAYRIDAGPWRSAGDSGDCEFSPGTRGRTIAYRATFTSTDHALSARLDDVTVRFAAWTGRAGQGSAGGGGPSTNGGSGVAGYGAPGVAPAAQAGDVTAGGTAAGAGGGAGTGPSGTGGPASGASAAGGTAAAGVPTGVQPAGTQGGQQVSGLTMTAGNGAAGGGGGGLGPRRWRGLLVAAVPVALVTMAAMPWVLVGRRRKQLLTYEHALSRRPSATRIKLLDN